MNVIVEVNEHVRLRNGLATIALSLPQIGAHEVVDLEFDAIVRALGEPQPVVKDLLTIAGIVYVLDKAVPRRNTDDAWTRVFTVQFPVANPELWAEVQTPLAEALSFLTGDEWVLEFTKGRSNLFSPRRRIAVQPKVDTQSSVSLFSGGLDSLAGVIDALTDPEVRLLLVGHHDAAGPSADQTRLQHLLDAVPAYQHRTDRMSVRLRPLPPSLAQPGQQVLRAGREHTLRSRSFVFLSLGLAAANAIGRSTPLLVPENGFIAVNVPLTPSRIGSCSTRTTHPYFLQLIQRVAAGLGLAHPIINPFELKTKGETLLHSLGQETLLHLADESVSCAHGSRRARWERRTVRNCGYCIPCLIRRAALHRLGVDAGLQYGIDVCAGEMDADAAVAEDLRALLDCLRSVRTLDDRSSRLQLAGPIPLQHRSEYVDMVGRGLDELREFITAKGTSELKARAGLP